MRAFVLLAFALSLAPAAAQTPVGAAPSQARTADGAFIAWREHVIDDPAGAGLPLTGGDGLILVDLDGDGREDIVSVHESDTRYDGVPAGYVRAAFAGAGPGDWFNRTLAEGPAAGAPEDVASADFNADGFPDLVVACELGHVLYLQNPGAGARDAPWPSLILPPTAGRGSFIRVFAGDLDGDGRPEATAANKGEQNPGRGLQPKRAASIFTVSGPALQGSSWRERVLGEYRIPQNAELIDLDSDGDLDVMVGSRGEGRLILHENLGGPGLNFRERAVEIDGARAAGFNLAFADLSGDGRLDVISAAGPFLIWLEQPQALDGVWRPHRIGTFAPDSMTGFVTADIDGDGDLDLFAGSYSRTDRDRDDPAAKPTDALGRLGWFENPGDARGAWRRHDVSRRVRGMFDRFAARDLDGDGDVDLIGTRGNSNRFDGVFWLEQLRTPAPTRAFTPARADDSPEIPLP